MSDYDTVSLSPLNSSTSDSSLSVSTRFSMQILVSNSTSGGATVFTFVCSGLIAVRPFSACAFSLSVASELGTAPPELIFP